MATYTYTTASDTMNGTLKISSLHKEISLLYPSITSISEIEAEPITQFSVSFQDDPGKQNIDEIVLSHEGEDSLEDAKAIRYNEIDEKTDLLISNGFVFDSTVFSLSLAAQKNWLAMQTFESSFVWPVEISTMSNGSYSLSQSDLNAFNEAGLSTVKGHLDSGRALKEQILNATNKSEVDLVVDNR